MKVRRKSALWRARRFLETVFGIRQARLAQVNDLRMLHRLILIERQIDKELDDRVADGLSGIEVINLVNMKYKIRTWMRRIEHRS